MTHTINGKCSTIIHCIHLHKIWPTDHHISQKKKNGVRICALGPCFSDVIHV